MLELTPYANRTPNDVKNELIDACGSGNMIVRPHWIEMSGEVSFYFTAVLINTPTKPKNKSFHCLKSNLTHLLHII